MPSPHDLTGAGAGVGTTHREGRSTISRRSSSSGCKWPCSSRCAAASRTSATATTRAYSYHRASCKAFDVYAKQIPLPEATHRNCLDALERMYMGAKSEASKPYKHVFEKAHDLDLFRCYPSGRMLQKIDAIKTELGVEHGDLLAKKAVQLIALMGDRVLFSPCATVSTQGYHRERFAHCSSLEGALDALQMAGSLEDLLAAAAPTLPAMRPGALVMRGAELLEGAQPTRVRFIGSHFKRLLAAQNAKWRLILWDKQAVAIQRAELLDALRALIAAHCQHYRSVIKQKEGNAFERALTKLTDKQARVEDVAVVLWSATKAQANLGGREFCSVLNEALRVDTGVCESADEHSSVEAQCISARLEPATLLTAMLQARPMPTRSKRWRHSAF